MLYFSFVSDSITLYSNHIHHNVILCSILRSILFKIDLKIDLNQWRTQGVGIGGERSAEDAPFGV